jgi:hypothetical protein
LKGGSLDFRDWAAAETLERGQSGF